MGDKITVQLVETNVLYMGVMLTELVGGTLKGSEAV